MLAVGPDRALYVGMGDGGSGGDPENRAQDPEYSGTIWSLAVRNGKLSRVRREPFVVKNLSSFGEGTAGVLYLVSLDGIVYGLAA